jgi:signal transduction histidine kinase
MAHRISWHSIAAVALLVLLATLGTLQYRWVGAVSEAERARMRTTLRTKLSDFSEAFDHELTRTYGAFHVDRDQLEAQPARVLTDAFVHWQSTAIVPDLIDDVYLVESGRDRAVVLEKLDLSAAALRPVEWPPALERWRERALRPSAAFGDAPPLLMPDPIDASIPALNISIPGVTRFEHRNGVEVIARPDLFVHTVVVVLNADRLRRQVLEPLVARYFGTGATSEYLLSVVRRDDPAQVVYASDGQATAIDGPEADATAGLFDLRLEDLARLRLPIFMRRESGTLYSKMAITIVRRNGGDITRVASNAGPEEGAWQARVRFRGGSLDMLVAQSRRRDLAIGLGILALLAASLLLIMASAARQRRLARQQLEFVAAVSHELRTPLAVIRSAGENLADGIVAGNEDVKRYGSLIETEGRRLTDMVERVMSFAGIASRSTAAARREVDLALVADAAIASARAEGGDRGVSVMSHIDPAIRWLAGDADGLRSALQNVLSNAVKYSPAGSTVDVDVSADGPVVKITVTDRGIGIDSDEMSQIFRPFFRGRRAIEAQIRGTGIGLSVVRHVIDAHRGDIRVESRPGEGTTITMTLPIVPVEDASGVAAVRSAHA